MAHSGEHDGFYLLLKYADVKRAMADNQTFSSEPQVLRPMLPRKPIPALEMDPPRHGPWRALFSAAITAKTPQEMQPFVRSDVNAHIDAFIEDGACDIVASLAEPVPAETICRLVGIDDALVPAVRKGAIEMFAAQGNPDEFARKQAAFAAITVTEIHERRARPRNDYLTRLADAQIEGRRLEDDDFVVLLAAFLGAGHHSTTSAMASLINEVFSRPTVRDTVRNDPGKIPLAVEETLRLFFWIFQAGHKAGVDLGHRNTARVRRLHGLGRCQPRPGGIRDTRGFQAPETAESSSELRVRHSLVSWSGAGANGTADLARGASASHARSGSPDGRAGLSIWRRRLRLLAGTGGWVQRRPPRELSRLE